MNMVTDPFVFPLLIVKYLQHHVIVVDEEHKIVFSLDELRRTTQYEVLHFALELTERLGHTFIWKALVEAVDSC